MVTQFSPVQPGWTVLFEGGPVDTAKLWLPLLGWLNEPSAEDQFQPCVWYRGLAVAETAADALGYTAWSVVEPDFV